MSQKALHLNVCFSCVKWRVITIITFMILSTIYSNIYCVTYVYIAYCVCEWRIRVSTISIHMYVCTYPIIITQLTVSGWLVFIPKKNHTQCIYWIYTRPPPINIQFPYIFQICLQFQIAIIMHTNHSQVTHQTETPQESGRRRRRKDAETPPPHQYMYNYVVMRAHMIII